MSWLSRLFFRARAERDLDRELAYHFDRQVSDLIAQGLNSADAVRQARLAFGGREQIKEAARDVRGTRWMEDLLRDCRNGLRLLRRTPAFTTVAVVSLALGIGANTAIFSLIDSILLRSLPVTDPASLVTINWRSRPFTFPSRDGVRGSEFVMRDLERGPFYREPTGVTAGVFPYPAFERLHQVSAPVLSSLFAYFPAGSLNLVLDGEAELGNGEWVSGTFFSGLEVSAAAGRLFVADDDRVGAPPVAVLSMGYSLRRFGGAARAVGQPIVINRVAFTVIGVTPPEFFGVDPASSVDVYLPMHANVLFSPAAAGVFAAQNAYWLQMMGRLRPGVTAAQAEAVLGPVFSQWAASTASNDRERANLPALRINEGSGGLDSLRRRYSRPLVVLLAIVGLILAIACANTASLLLARAAARRGEMAVRLSMGAGRLRLVRQLLTESIMLALLGGALGVVIAVGGIRLLTRLLANGEPGLSLRPELNWPVLLTTIGLSLACGLAVGLAPAIQSTRPALMPALKAARSTESWMRVRNRRLRLNPAAVLVVAQVAVSLLLLVAAGLFVRTLASLQSIDVGFNRDGVLLFDVDAGRNGRSQSEVAAFYADLQRRLRDLPGVAAATLSRTSLIRAGSAVPITVHGTPAPGISSFSTGASFFSAMQIPVLQGREFDERDRADSRPVVVVNDVFARKYFPDVNPVGRSIGRGGTAPRELEIVGVTATARYGGLRGEIPPVVYFPYTQYPPLRQVTYAVRTHGDPLSHVNTVRRAVREADAQVPVANVRTLASDIDRTINQEIVFARLCSAFAILGLVIACFGVYGTMSHAVARRVGEIGLRMALGARRSSLVWMVLRDVCVMTAGALAISIPIVLAASRLIESFLFGIEPNDPLALALAVSVLVGAALVAGLGPALKASRINPLIALRQE
jgi:predicted permease